MDYNELEVAILKFLRPRLGIQFTPREVYEGVKKEKLAQTELSVLGFNLTLNALIKEGLVEGRASQDLDSHNVEGIDADGLKFLRRTFGPS